MTDDKRDARLKRVGFRRVWFGDTEKGRRGCSSDEDPGTSSERVGGSGGWHRVFSKASGPQRVTRPVESEVEGRTRGVARREDPVI